MGINLSSINEESFFTDFTSEDDNLINGILFFFAQSSFFKSLLESLALPIQESGFSCWTPSNSIKQIKLSLPDSFE